MISKPITRRTFVAASALAIIASSAAAHHGWSWAEGEQTELTGVIQEVYIGQPHPTLTVETESDGVWTIELANPGQTARSGFNEDSATAGDTITALGNRSSNPDEKRMKAVRIVVRGKTYDLYPDRIQS